MTPSGSTARCSRASTTEAVKRAFQRAVRRAGIEGLRFYDLHDEATKNLRMLRRYTHLKAEGLATTAWMQEVRLHGWRR